MKNLIIAIILIFAGLQTMQAQRHTMYVTTISGENGGAEIATNVFNSFGERCVPAFNDLQFDVEQDIYIFIADASSLNINGEEYTVLPAQVSELTDDYFDIHEDGEWYAPGNPPTATTNVNSRWTIGLSNRLFGSQIRAIEADGWTKDQAALDRARRGTHVASSVGTLPAGDVFFYKDVPASTGEIFRYEARYFSSGVYVIYQRRIHPTPAGGFIQIPTTHLNQLMNCAISRY